MKLFPHRFEELIESEFQAHYREESVRILRFSAPVGAAIYMAYFVWDIFAIPRSLTEALSLRLLGGALLISFVLISPMQFFARHAQPITAVLTGAVGVLVAILISMAELGFSAHGVSGVVIVILYMSMSFRLRAPLVLAAAIAISVTTHIFMVSEGLSVEMVLANDIHLGGASLLGSAFALIMEANTRHTFELERGLRIERDRTRALVDEVRDANRSRISWLENFAGFLRHELKNQLIGIRTSVDLESRRTSEPSVYVGRARRSVDIMFRLLNSASEATSLEASVEDDELERMDLGELVSGRVAEFADMFPDRSFAEPDMPADPIIVEASAPRMIQMLDKLLANACDHGDTDGEVQVCISAAGDWAEIAIENEGGSFPEDTSRLFEPFYTHRKSAGGRPTDSLGIGLYVAKLITEAYGGEIKAERLVEPPGARFSVRLPRVVA